IWTNESVVFNFTKDSPKSMGIPYPKYYFLNSTIRPAQGYDGSVQDSIRMFYHNGLDNAEKTAQWYGSEYGWFSFTSPQLNYLEPGAGYYSFPVNNSYTQQVNESQGILI
ncbi:hypothetical protein ACFL0W_02885, partial [Nanoarchaeota archaeon]